MTDIAYPYGIDARGRTSLATSDEHVRDLLEQVLFTAPGERVNRPSFGTGLSQLVFAGNGDDVATATQFLVQSGLQQWLGDVITVEAVEVENVDARLRITVVYTIRREQRRRTATFTQEHQ